MGSREEEDDGPPCSVTMLTPAPTSEAATAPAFEPEPAVAQTSSSSATAAPAPFRGPAADSVLGERLIDVIGIVAAMGYVAEVAYCPYLCGETYRKGDTGALLSLSCEHDHYDIVRPLLARGASGSAQLIHALRRGDRSFVLQLVQLGVLLEDTCRRQRMAVERVHARVFHRSWISHCCAASSWRRWSSRC
jgi:hypothetical protein